MKLEEFDRLLNLAGQKPLAESKDSEIMAKMSMEERINYMLGKEQDAREPKDSKEFAIMNKDGNLFCTGSCWSKSESKAVKFKTREAANKKKDSLNEKPSADRRSLEVTEL